MGEQKRGEDAANQAPAGAAPKAGSAGKVGPDPGDKPKPDRQDAPNYDETTDGGRAIRQGDLSSANDE